MQTNQAVALEFAISETSALNGRDRFFALYNQAELLFLTGQNEQSVTIFDVAFNLYQILDDAQRPWRILWYRDSAYQAYFQAGRYQSVIDLASSTLAMLSKRGLEESHFWRGMAYKAMGNTEQARFDYEIALKLRPTYEDAKAALDRLPD